jgi:hypothetical protein
MPARDLPVFSITPLIRTNLSSEVSMQTDPQSACPQVANMRPSEMGGKGAELILTAR